jgi:uncharacterized protein
MGSKIRGEKAMSAKTVASIVLLAAASFVALGASAQEPTLNQVYQAAESGNFSEAQRMMDQVLRDHPNSAKAHYVEAELLAKQGRFAAAESELATAERLEPGLPFAKPQAVSELKQRISTSRALRPTAATGVAPAASGGGGIPWGSLLLIGGIAAVVIFVVRAVRRRSASMVPANSYGSAYPAGYGPGAPGQPGQPYGAPGPVAGGGMGSGILGSLATGAAVGAGIVAGEALAHRIGGEHGGDAGAAPMVGGAQPMPDDMGGKDFGVADSSSWDDGGGFIGGADGGGSDWS